MALCYIAIACNGTRDNIYGVYPTKEAALERLKLIFADSADDEFDPANATSVTELGFDAQIVEVSDGGEGFNVEIHGKW